MDKHLFEAIKKRRSIYSIDKNVSVSDEEIESILDDCVLYAPTGFNAQSDRVVLLLSEAHENLWKLIKRKIEETTHQENRHTAIEKVEKLSKGYGTVLFFEDKAVVKKLQKQFTAYADYFPSWSQQGNGMLQYLVWLALSQAGLGASLQHYNVMISEEVREEFNLPESWCLVSQMPFGNPTEIPSDEKAHTREGKTLVFR